MANKISFSEDQERVYQGMLAWLRNPNELLTVGGYAGCGKTTLLSCFIEDHPYIRFACATYTGKAANVLAQKLQHLSSEVKVSTLHSLLYYPSVASKEDDKVTYQKKPKGSIEADILVVDEASMVNDEIFKDLKAHDIPILAIGDHGQLGPIEGDSVLMADPILRLEKIHRQAEHSPILRLSRHLREDKTFPEKMPEGIRVLSWAEFNKEIRTIAASGDDFRSTTALCYKNTTRVAINQNVRWARFGADVEAEKPVPSDVVICLRNNKQDAVFNGMRGVVRRYDFDRVKHPKQGLLHVHFPDDDGRHFYGPVIVPQFGREKTYSSIAELREDGVKGISNIREIGGLFDYGYAMTVHKAQGSGFNRVYLVREKPGLVDDASWARWAYTGVTRAISELVIVEERFKK